VRTEGVVLAKPRDAGQPAPLSPIAGIRIAQNVLPLAATIEKVGEGIVQGAVRRFDIQLSDAHDVLLPNVSAVQQEFVRGHYWTLSESERLRVPALEQHKAGVEFSADEVVFDAARAVDLDVDYEVLVVPGDEPAVATGRSIAIDAAILQRWARVPAQRRVARQQDRGRVEQRTDAVRARPTRYVAPDGGGMSMNVPPESVDLAAASAVVAEYVRRSA
jgi:hypothetical protein